MNPLSNNAFNPATAARGASQANARDNNGASTAAQANTGNQAAGSQANGDSFQVSAGFSGEDFASQIQALLAMSQQLSFILGRQLLGQNKGSLAQLARRYAYQELGTVRPLERSVYQAGKGDLAPLGGDYDSY